ncbi:MAG: bifunctional glutamate N-acetyltransferase/amino-acid acetyltransferase ArgJ [Clostridia bacterium]|nr:bifunctional glutamate N-acetyltransferase/amino-acid acetyltransferase ArgJ [Clostridia bacterium]MDE6758359.1 bifunctional glutamate N-acetyltransferase/amino-acid acetyltransferase ArgJ [Clostridia bacterium]MDE7079374.1 bifunctional glutamate N-acetyltransferase/amino-acid acetyltransferase ArgJ [Clostridia bacterium]
MKRISGGVCASKGFKANGVHCGIRKNREKPDLALIVSDVECAVASVYTQNKVKGAPILVTKRNIADGKARAIICNSGNANTCNADGEEKATQMCKLVEQHTGISASDVVVASTGVIGQTLDIKPIEDAMPKLVEGLNERGGHKAGRAIMTTDTVLKERGYVVKLGGVECHIGGIAKGSGMIHPNMATMLCFITTDINITSQMLNMALHKVVKDTFNMVSVDGDTSTNDMVTVMASGLAGNELISEKGPIFNQFCVALRKIMREMSKDIAKDGEGATKLIECRVTKAKGGRMARAIAKSVVTSSLVKSALFAADANWGRILCAIGYTDEKFDITKIDVDLKSRMGTIAVCRKGVGVEFDETAAHLILGEDEVMILINCNQGGARAVAWGCDLTYEYVRINADYRT